MAEFLTSYVTALWGLYSLTIFGCATLSHEHFWTLFYNSSEKQKFKTMNITKMLFQNLVKIKNLEQKSAKYAFMTKLRTQFIYKL